MSDSDYKKYTIQARTGIRGEAFFESLICDYCIPHHISGSKDLGLDYICEWMYGDKPTGVLFAVQVKTSSGRKNPPKCIGVERGRNELSKFEIRNDKLRINKKTLIYWKGLGIPVYLFYIHDYSGDFNCYYKRFTEILVVNEEYNRYESNYFRYFYKVNNDNYFIGFKESNNLDAGFARDLFIDYVHFSYYKGMIAYLNPNDIGLKNFRADGVFQHMIEQYKDKITDTFNRTRQILEHLGYDTDKKSYTLSRPVIPQSTSASDDDKPISCL